MSKNGKHKPVASARPINRPERRPVKPTHDALFRAIIDDKDRAAATFTRLLAGPDQGSHGG